MRLNVKTQCSLRQAVALITLRLENSNTTNAAINELLADARVEGERSLTELMIMLVNLSS